MSRFLVRADILVILNAPQYQSVWWSGRWRRRSISPREQFVNPLSRMIAGSDCDQRSCKIPYHVRQKRICPDPEFEHLAIRLDRVVDSPPFGNFQRPLRPHCRCPGSLTRACKRPEISLADKSLTRIIQAIQINRSPHRPDQSSQQNRGKFAREDTIPVLPPNCAESGMKPFVNTAHPIDPEIVW